MLDWRVGIDNVDIALTRWYRGGVHVLYTLPAQILLAVLAVAGLVAFFLGGGRMGEALQEHPAGAALLLFLIPAQLFATVIHEAGHAFTAKAFGREVPRAGVGWYWFGPMAFVDTSDMWLADRWPRVAVSLAGPYANLVLGSLAALVAWLVPSILVAAALWQFALASYVSVLSNLNPLLEFDGYYVLMDLLDRPNLRPRALAWLGRGLLPALRTPGALRGHTVDLLYGLGSVIYVALTVAVVVELYRLVVQDWIARLVPVPVAAGLAWVVAAAVVATVGASVYGDMRGTRAGSA